MNIWGLYNALRGWTLYDLTVNEVQLLVQVMSANEIKLIKVAKPNDPTWEPLSELIHPQFFEKRKVSELTYPSLHQSDKNATSELDTEYFVVRPRKHLPRLYKRHDVNLPCLVKSTTKNFQTESVNMSEGGMQFKDTLPDWIAGYFIVAITGNTTGVIQLMCSLVEDQKEKRRVQIVSEDTDPQYCLYREWLASLN